jgi:iron-sulfur cluster assembly accessory protein
MDVIITAAAEKFVRRMLRLDGTPGSGFRLVVTAGGCSGLASEFSVEAAPRPGDAEIELSGLKVFLPATSRLLLAGVTIDFADTPTQTGLVFRDPKAAAGACGRTAAAGSLPAALPAEGSVTVASIGRRAASPPRPVRPS